jgi:hypothetical protein
LVSAVALAACVGAISWFGLRGSIRRKERAIIQAQKPVVVGQQQHSNTLALTDLALQDEKKFDALLDEESRKSLPKFQGEHSALKVLAQD